MQNCSVDIAYTDVDWFIDAGDGVVSEQEALLCPVSDVDSVDYRIGTSETNKWGKRCCKGSPYLSVVWFYSSFSTFLNHIARLFHQGRKKESSLKNELLSCLSCSLFFRILPPKNKKKHCRAGISFSCAGISSSDEEHIRRKRLTNKGSLLFRKLDPIDDWNYECLCQKVKERRITFAEIIVGLQHCLRHSSESAFCRNGKCSVKCSENFSLVLNERKPLCDV